MSSTEAETKTPCLMVVEFLKQYKIRFCPTFHFLELKVNILYEKAYQGSIYRYNIVLSSGQYSPVLVCHRI